MLNREASDETANLPCFVTNGGAATNRRQKKPTQSVCSSEFPVHAQASNIRALIKTIQDIEI